MLKSYWPSKRETTLFPWRLRQTKTSKAHCQLIRRTAAKFAEIWSFVIYFERNPFLHPFFVHKFQKMYGLHLPCFEVFHVTDICSFFVCLCDLRRFYERITARKSTRNICLFDQCLWSGIYLVCDICSQTIDVLFNN